jgi:hypothetical protein
LIRVWGGVEPELYGPFGTEEERDEEAKDLFGMEHAVFKLYFEDGVPSLGSYTGEEVDDLTGGVDPEEDEDERPA